MADNYEHDQQHHHKEHQPVKTEEAAPGPVETSDSGLFDFTKKKEEVKPQEEVIVAEFEEKVQVSEEDRKHGGILEKLHRSDSSSSSSSDEEEGDGEEETKKKKGKKEKKSLKEKLHKDEEKHEEKVEDTEVPVEKIHVEEVVYSESSQPAEEKRGFLDKIKEKLPGQHKKPDDVADASPSPPPSSAPVAAECAAAEHVGEGKEKKGFLEKMKEKIPGFHSKGDQEEKEKEKCAST